MKKANELNVFGLWLQPDTADKECMDFIKSCALKDRTMYDPNGSLHQAHTHVGQLLQRVFAKEPIKGSDGGCHPKLNLVKQDVLADAAAAAAAAVTKQAMRAPCLLTEGTQLFASNAANSGSLPVERNMKEGFRNAKHFAVVGATEKKDKWGYKVMQWYLEQNLDVVPVNPVSPISHFVPYTHD